MFIRSRVLMPEKQREIQELFADYAAALRDGCIATFLKSLTRQEAESIVSSDQFSETAETAQLLNDIAFADEAVMPDVGLFISRVDAAITSRQKQARATSYRRRTRQEPANNNAINKAKRTI